MSSKAAAAKVRINNAFRAMKELGIPQDKVRPVLKNLLKLFDKKWEPIEAENYRALIDAIFESDDAPAEEQPIGVVNNQVAEQSSLNIVNCPNEDEVEEEETEVLARPKKKLRLKYQDGSSSHNATNGERRAELLTPKEEPGEPPETVSVKLTRRRVVDSPVPNSTDTLVESQANTSQSLGKRQRKQSTSSSKSLIMPEGGDSGIDRRQQSIPTESGSLSHEMRLRDRGNGSVSPKIPPKRPVSESHSNHLHLEGPRGDTGTGLSPNHKNSATFPIVIKDEPFTDDMALAEHPLALVPPVLAIRDGSSGQSALDESCNKLEVASSSFGEVKLSISSDRPDLLMPSLDEILKYAEEKCLKSYKILDPNFSLKNIMQSVCQSVVELRSEANSQPPKTIDVTPAVDLLNKSSVADTLGARGLCSTSPDVLVHCQSNVEVLDPVTPATPPHCDGIDEGDQANKIGGSDESGSDREEPGSISDQTNNLSLVMVQQPDTVTPDIVRSIHDAVDITKGQEKIAIMSVDEVNGSFPAPFYYIPQNAVFQNANVNFSLARVGEGDSCVGCFGDCLSTATPCACVTGGGSPYSAKGLLKDEFLDECMSIISDPFKHSRFYCKECPLERSKSMDSVEHCKGHHVKKFIKECWLKCGCNKICGNRVVQRGISHKLQVFMTSDGKGWGLRTLEDLPRGAFVCEYVGEVLTVAEFFTRVRHSPSEKKQSYPIVLDANWHAKEVMKDEDALCLDATCFGNIGRFINHSCFDPNLIEIPVEVESHDRHYYHVGLFTKKAVKAMEELTWDYGIDFNDNDHPVKAFDCKCGSPFCRSIKHSSN